MDSNVKALSPVTYDKKLVQGRLHFHVSTTSPKTNCEPPGKKSDALEIPGPEVVNIDDELDNSEKVEKSDTDVSISKSESEKSKMPVEPDNEVVMIESKPEKPNSDEVHVDTTIVRGVAVKRSNHENEENPIKKRKLDIKSKLAKFVCSSDNKSQPKDGGESISDFKIENENKEQTENSKMDVDIAVNPSLVDETNETCLTPEEKVTPSKEISEVNDVEDIEILSEVESKTPNNKKTPTSRKKTPKQLEKEAEMSRRREEKEKLRQEKEKRKQLEKEEKLKQKEEKEIQKKKELEEKEEQKRKLKEEKELQKKKELEEKEEQKRKLKEEKELKKQLEIDVKNEEKRRKDEEKRKKEEDESNKLAKEAVAFTNFFKKVGANKTQPSEATSAFKPFPIKSGMRLAPTVRVVLSENSKVKLEQHIEEQDVCETYITQLRCGEITPGHAANTWPLEELYQDVVVLDLDLPESTSVAAAKPRQPKPKLLLFHENRRPPYWGTWRKKCREVGARKPFGQFKCFEYDVDSDDEWEEEEPGESLHGSDDEKDMEEEDDYEVDNDFFVPHGYLSEDEDQEQETWSPEEQKAKLKLLGEQFNQERNEKTRQLRPVVLGCFWATEGAEKVSNKVTALLAARAAISWVDESPISISRIAQDDDCGEAMEVEVSPKTTSKKAQVDSESIPALIRLVHGSTLRRKLLVLEFLAYCSQENPSASLPPKAVVGRKIKELAQWQECPEPPIQGRYCWYVSPEVREQYDCNDTTLPNSWKFITITDRKRISDVTPDDSPRITKFTKILSEEERKLSFGEPDVLELPSSAKKSPSVTKITKFTKVLTKEERKLLLVGEQCNERTTPPPRRVPLTKVLVEKDNSSTDCTPTNLPKAACPASEKIREKLNKFRAPFASKNKSEQTASESVSEKPEPKLLDSSDEPIVILDKTGNETDSSLKAPTELANPSTREHSNEDVTAPKTEESEPPPKKRVALISCGNVTMKSSSVNVDNPSNPIVKKRAILISSEPLGGSKVDEELKKRSAFRGVEKIEECTSKSNAENGLPDSSKESCQSESPVQLDVLPSDVKEASS